jgi:hypothetical protein
MKAQTKHSGAMLGDKALSIILHRIEKRKPAILAQLRDVRRRGPSTAPFDEEGAWDALKMFLYLYVGRDIARKRTRPSPEIRKRFNKLAADMEQVRLPLFELLDSRELTYVVDAGERIGVEVIQDICTSVKSLEALETAVREACKDIPLKLGRPHDRALWPAEVGHLAEVYIESTGCKPGSGKGPFARFVYSVLSALGQNVSEDHVIDVIKGSGLARSKIVQGYKESSKVVPR